MSISSMTNVAYARRRDVDPANRAPDSIGAIAAEKGDKPQTQTQGSSALSAIAAYIPTEILTVYVAVIAAIGVGASANTGNAAWISFGFFFVLTPIVVWLVYAGKVRRAGKPIPARIGQWPKWEMFAATIAYTAWAFALPETPFTDFDWYNAAIAGLAVLGVTTALGLLAPVVAQPLEA